MSLFLPFSDTRTRLHNPLSWPLYFPGPSAGLAGGIVCGAAVYAMLALHGVNFGEWHRGLFLAFMTFTALLMASVVMMAARQIALPLRNHVLLLPCVVAGFDAWVLHKLVLGYFRTRGWPFSGHVTFYAYWATDYFVWFAAAMLLLGCILVALRLRHPDSALSDGNGSLWVTPIRKRQLARQASAPPRVAAAAQAPRPAPAAGQPAQQAAPAYRYPATASRLDFAHLYGNEAFKAALLDDARRWRNGWDQPLSNDAKNGILLFGPPGTGKTAFAEALSAEIGARFVKATFGDFNSKWIGQGTEQLVKLFDDALAQQPCILFIDEIDAVLKSRDNLGGGQPEEYSRMVTTFLDKSTAIRGTQVLLVGATNYIDKLDAAAIREGRFDFHHQVPLPDAPAREGLLKEGMAKGHCTTDDDTLARLVRRWAGFNVPRLLACAEGACELGRVRQDLPERPSKHEPAAPTALTYDDFYKALRKLQGRRGGAPEGAKALAELFMDPPQERALRTLATELVRVDEVEHLGGQLPKGVLFCGPPGTGKTATAMAMARESGWSFITRTGRQLLADGAVAKLGQEASDLRPAIVFIDEADDVLGDRTRSPYKAATNELLTAIDGAKGMLCDVVWVAATNHPESMDSAATRGGRFGRKIEFAPPGLPTVERLIGDWVQRKTAAHAVRLDTPADVWVADASKALCGLAPSDIYQALNEANTAVIAEALQSGREAVLGVAALAARRGS
ncbi:MAG TPA: AAA family ATPase [Rhodanobacteraceae bacterium]